MTDKTRLRFIKSGDSALLCRLADIIDPDISRKVNKLHKALSQKNLPFVIESVPSYNGLMIYYNPLGIAGTDLESIVSDIFDELENSNPEYHARKVKLPVCYDEEFAPDIRVVCEHSGLDIAEIVNLHSSAEYLVYMIGFTPGFPYLGGLDERLHTPRRDEPRTHVDAGSVGIAGSQTGIYPLSSPGGWQIIGMTPVKLYNPESSDPFLLRPGDLISFEPVSSAGYWDLLEEIKIGNYRPIITGGDESN